MAFVSLCASAHRNTTAVATPAEPSVQLLAAQRKRLAEDNCGTVPRKRQPDPNFKFGSLHDVVGRDGVLVISLLRKPERFERSAKLLKKAGIWATEYPAADNYCVQKKELDRVCPLHEDEEHVQQICGDDWLAKGKHGTGCKHTVEQAIAESHRRALAAAQKRSSAWTAILEEDVVPVRPSRWDAAFRKAWKRVPRGIKMVRLSWCNFPGDHPGYTMGMDTFADIGDFALANWTGYHPVEPGNLDGRVYNAGGCTGGYMVHRSIIPEIMKLFPCCCALDCCLQHDLFEKIVPIAGGREGPLGMQMMLSMDAWGSIDYAMNYTYWGLYQSGVMVQDARENPSTRQEFEGEKRTWNMADKSWHMYTDSDSAQPEDAKGKDAQPDVKRKDKPSKHFKNGLKTWGVGSE